jgi:hypothetical protein
MNTLKALEKFGAIFLGELQTKSNNQRSHPSIFYGNFVLHSSSQFSAQWGSFKMFSCNINCDAKGLMCPINIRIIFFCHINTC